ncbi:MAG: hypothetical protein ACK4UJ_11190 [Leptonema sp. (in: bacteria)]
MEHTDQYQLKKIHYFCVNLKINLYQELLSMSYGNINSFLEYLYEKFKNRLLHLKIAPHNRRATAQYQPKGKYKKIKLNKIDPSLWQKYWDLRNLSGYSISFILRVFLEWELMDRGTSIEDFLLPALNINDSRLTYRYPSPYRTMNNYSIKKSYKKRNRTIYLYYWDDT